MWHLILLIEIITFICNIKANIIQKSVSLLVHYFTRLVRSRLVSITRFTHYCIYIYIFIYLYKCLWLSKYNHILSIWTTLVQNTTAFSKGLASSYIGLTLVYPKFNKRELCPDAPFPPHITRRHVRVSRSHSSNILLLCSICVFILSICWVNDFLFSRLYIYIYIALSVGSNSKITW